MIKAQAITFHRQEVLKAISEIEKHTQEMFHQSHVELADEHSKLMDNAEATQSKWSNFKYKLYRIIEENER